MKRSLICFIIFIAFGITLFADTIIQDSTNVYGTWSYENSPYIVEGEAIVPEDSTLVIEPGVTVKFQIGPSQNHNNSNGHLIVNGKLEAIGTESDSIRFTRNDSIGYWGIIYFSETSDSTSVISKSIIEYANYNVNFSGPWSQHQGAISFYQSTALIENNLIMNNNKNGICIFGEESNVIVNENIIKCNGINGIECKYTTNTIYITNNNILMNNNDGMYFEYSYPNILNCMLLNNNNNGIFTKYGGINIQDCIIRDNYSHGLCSYYSYGENEFVINCVIQNNDYGIYFYQPYDDGCSHIISSLITNNNIGILAESSNPRLYNNTVIDNNYSLQISNAKIINSIIGESNLFLVGHKIISHTLFTSRINYVFEDYGYNMIGVDPMFTNNGEYQYTLQSNSPALFAGTPDTTGLFLPETDIAGNPRIHGNNIDIGAFEYSNDIIYIQLPGTGEGWKRNTVQTIKWGSNIDNVRIEYQSDTGNWDTIIASAIDCNEYNWLVPDILSDECNIRITSNINEDIFDITDGSFSINEITTIPNCRYLTDDLILSNSPYFVNGEAIISIVDSINILPGVEIRFKTGNNFDYLSNDFDAGFFKVNGTLIAEGTEQDSIIFNREGITGYWGVIYCTNRSDSTSFKYCKITGGSSISNLSPYFTACNGAISLLASDSKIDHCNINNNSYNGLWLRSSSGYITNSIIKNNVSGIYIHNNSFPIILNNTISQNSDQGVRCFDNISDYGITLIGNTISFNDIGIYSQSSEVNVRNNYIANNQARGVWLNYGVINLINCIIADNTCGIYNYGGICNSYNNLITNNLTGGTISISGASSVIINNTIINNQSTAIGNYSGSYVNVANSIIWDNSQSFDANYFVYVCNSLIQGSELPELINNIGGNILDTDPLFDDPLNGNFELQSDSPAIDAGSFYATNLDSIDLVGNSRISNGRVDIGAYEYQQTGDWLWVTSPLGGEFIESSSSFLITWIRSDTSSTVTIEFFDGADWSTISNSAVNTGEYNDWIAPGIDSDDCLIRITDNGNNEITNVSDNTFSIKGNIIEHNEEVSGIWTLDDSPYTIIGKATIPAGSTLSIEPGVEVEFKTGSMNTVSSDYFDKGMLQVNGKLEAVGSSESPITFSRNGEDGYWGMIYFTSTADTTSILSHCNIEYADALITSDIFFGGISFNNSSAIVENCDISNCYYGIDISYSSEPIIRNNKIHYNIYGGILCWSSSNTEIIGNAIYNNGYIANETYGGIGIRCYSSSPPLINNTISLSVSERRLDRTRIEVNAGEYEKSLNLSTRNLLYGIYCEESSSPYITNSLVYGNGPFEEGANIYIESGSPHLSYCLLEDQTFPPGAIDEGNNVLGANPFFVDAANENFQLRYISPCINAGIPDTTGLNLPEYDLNGNPRVFAGENAIIDIGAYEYQGEPLQIDFSADITSGNAPLIVEFTVTANYPADVYEWDFDNDEVIDAAGESVSWEFPVGVYTVTLNAIYGLDVIIIEKENYITSLNSPPFVENPVTAVSFDEDMIDSNLDLNYIFSDENGDSLSFYNSGNDSIMVEIEDGIVILSGGLNWYGTEVITFTADDGYIERGNDLISEKQNQDYSRSTRNIFSKANESISGRVAASLDIEITIEPVNDPPEIDLPESITFFEDESLNFDLTSYVDDVDLDLLTIAAVEFEGDSLSAIYEDLQVVFSAVANWYGLTEVAVTITDNVSRITATDIFTVEVIAVNDDPEIDLPDSFTFLEDESLVVDFSEFVDDVDNVDLVLSCAGNLEIGVEIDSLIVTFTATENWFGSELLTFTVDDQQGRAVAFDSVEVIVTPINDAPEIELPESFSFNEDESLVVDFAPYINDIDGDELIIVSENYVHVIVNIEEHIVTFTASENWYGVETIIFTVYDTEARLSANDIVNVIVEPENDPPTIDLPDNFTFLEDESLVVDFGEFVNDVDDVDLLLSCAGNLYINVDIDSLIVTFTAMENWNGSELLTFTIDDQQGREIATDEVDIVVEAVMYPPLINLPCSFTLEEDTELYVNFAFFILGGDEFELTADAHENIDIEINGFGVTFTPSTNWNGSEIITFTINDNQSRTTASDETIVIVTPINDTPEINLPDNFSFDEGSSLTVDFHQFVYDADGDSLLIINEPAENIWVETIDLEVTFSAEPGWTGSEYVFFMVDDAICRPEYMDSTLVIVNELWGHHYGDIDDNGSVEAYDAALILQYVVGIDPEPAAPLPWEDWQITAADVSGNLEIGAYDASLVIQYFVGLIYAFPVETFREEIVCQKADISVTLEDGILRFTSNSELYSLYLTLDEEIENYKCQENIISASNENRIALAAAYPITGEFLSIPVKLNYQQIKLIANEQYYEIELGDNIEMVNNLTVYPNPFNPEINISFELEESGYILLEVYNIKGQRVCTLISNEFTAGKHLVTWNASEQSSGIYLLQYQSENIMETRKIILLK